MKTTIIIPARFSSTRYPGKPLVKLSLPDGSKKTLIQLSWEAAKKVKGVDAVYVATENLEIKRATEAFGGRVILTSDSCKNGTERCSEAVEKEKLNSDLIINFQGDAPLTPNWFVEQLIDVMKTDNSIQVSTPIVRLNKTIYNHFVKDRKNGRVIGTTVVFDKNLRAMYFSKELIPFTSVNKLEKSRTLPFYYHVGVYGYKKEVLVDYKQLPEGELEALEGLEQLRFLESGHEIKCVKVKSKGKTFIELNNPKDVPLIERILSKEKS